jgi:TnsA endonuclease N terminal
MKSPGRFTEGALMSSKSWNGAWRGHSPNSEPHSPARDIVRRTGGIVSGKFPSRKTGRMVGHEELLELDAIYVFETAPNIVRYVEQPETLQYPDGNRLRRYTPDFLLEHTSGEKALVEIKPRSYNEDPDLRHKFARIHEHMARLNRRFFILTDEMIRIEPRLSNLKWIYHQAPRIPCSYRAGQAALAGHAHRFPMPIRDAATLLSPMGLDPFSLLMAGLLQCDLNVPLSMGSLVAIAEECGHGYL